MASPRAAAGSIAAFFPTESENRSAASASRKTISATAGDSRGRTIVRILYNRASARPDGKPWSERKKLVWWDEGKKQWTGLDVRTSTKKKPPDYDPPDGARGDDAVRGDKPFILHPDGVGWIWVPSGLKDGPLPTHYEPLESPFGNAVYPDQQTNPAATRKSGPTIAYAKSPAMSAFPTC